jgi:hypothetical protein
VSAPKQAATVLRDYQPQPGAMAQAVALLVSKSVLFDSQASRGGSHDLIHKAATATEGVGKNKKGQDRYVRR